MKAQNFIKMYQFYLFLKWINLPVCINQNCYIITIIIAMPQIA